MNVFPQRHAIHVPSDRPARIVLMDCCAGRHNEREGSGGRGDDPRSAARFTALRDRSPLAGFPLAPRFRRWVGGWTRYMEPHAEKHGAHPLPAGEGRSWSAALPREVNKFRSRQRGRTGVRGFLPFFRVPQGRLRYRTIEPLSGMSAHESLAPSPRRCADCSPMIQCMAIGAPRRPSPGGRGCLLGALSQRRDQAARFTAPERPLAARPSPARPVAARPSPAPGSLV